MCRTLLMRPWTGSGPLTTVAPYACAKACIPKHTPKTGRLVLLSKMARDSPADSGRGVEYAALCRTDRERLQLHQHRGLSLGVLTYILTLSWCARPW